MGPIYTLEDFVDMLRRRAGMILRLFLLGCLVSLVWAARQPHVYSSSEVIQIEQPVVASELARSTVEGSSGQRLQLIEQQLMARGTILAVIEKFDLYADLPGLRLSEKIDRLRASVTLEGVAAVPEGDNDNGALAVLTITALQKDPELARAVAHEFADRIRALAAEQRREKSRETLEFFIRQEESLQDALSELENELEAFRSENDLSMEGSVVFHRGQIASLNEAILALERDIIATRLQRERIDPNARPATVERLEADIATQVDSLTTQRDLLFERRETIARSLETSPEVQRELADLERGIENLQTQLRTVATRRNEAEVGFELERNDRGERLVTLEEAQTPDYADTLSRKMLALLGAGGSLFFALAVAMILELRHPVLRTARQMERETGLVPVVSLPEIKLPKEPRGLRRLWLGRRAAGRAGRLARTGQKA
ncbi:MULTISPECIES: GumC family protein [unclassified Sulfitobacter]|uniref:GumC family protein n=1 Tax=unclassified Sulfitobacter TaxID=196795 RepID=UPI0007C314E0|nr:MULTISPECIES: chain-length determining protein [unclassified Sulfitobacter]KZX94666.1 chain-length determining protein [Sulfitobacter sp. HI0023]KZY22594.1 chain-length determining protein [Sulfitobacter sp. HI0040]KZZ66106.1 chain-length determining protein [Sulfitobacter sp. HI0129]